jgi:hypothetical protein
MRFPRKAVLSALLLFGEPTLVALVFLLVPLPIATLVRDSPVYLVRYAGLGLALLFLTVVILQLPGYAKLRLKRKTNLAGSIISVAACFIVPSSLFLSAQTNPFDFTIFSLSGQSYR